MNVESRLIELIGEPGRRLHTARSRNDQVATDLRLYARRGCARAGVGDRRGAAGAVPARARARRARCCPGYTHLQRAQVVTLGHHLLAYAEMLARDRGRLVDAERRAAESPLGSGALAGTGLPIDRAAHRRRRSASRAARRTTAWTPSPIATSPPRSRSPAR